MKTHQILATFSAFAFSLAMGTAVAGPDWTSIERARAAKQAEAGKITGQVDSSTKQVRYSNSPRSPFGSVPYTDSSADSSAAKPTVAEASPSQATN